MSNRYIRLLLNACLALFSILLIILFSELILRNRINKPDWVNDLTKYVSYKDIDICGPYDPDTILMPRNSICDKTIDNYALRGTQQEILHPEPLIVFIGDSFVYGHGVIDSTAYPAVIQKLMNENAVPGKILNAGIPGSGTDIQVAYFEKYIIPKTKPDL